MKRRSTISLHDVLCKDKWTVKDIKKCLNSGYSGINDKNSDSNTPLLVALHDKNCSAYVVKLLLKHGADVNCKDALGHTALFVALKNSRKDAIVLELIKKDANVRVHDSLGRSLLCAALRHRASKDVILALLKKGCFVNACRDEVHAGSVLHCAIDHPQSVMSADILQMLIQRGAGINAFDSIGRSVICFALQMGNEARFIRLLLEAGAALDCLYLHNSPFHCATDDGSADTPLKADVVELLLKQGARVDRTVDYNDHMILQCALQRCKYETRAIGLLLDCFKGQDLNSNLDRKGNSLLQIAVTNPHCKAGVVPLLKKHGFRVDRVYPGRHSPLNIAVKHPKCQSKVLKALLQNGAELNHHCILDAVDMFHGVEVYRALLATGITFMKTSSVYYDLLYQSSTRMSRLVVLKLFLKYKFLTTFECHIPYLTSHHCHIKHLLRFRKQCVDELKEMQAQDVGHGNTLLDYLGGCSPIYKLAVVDREREVEEKTCDFDRLFEVVSHNAFPLYFEIIADKVGRPPIESKLHEVRMSTTVRSPKSGCEKEIFLPYECVLRIADYLAEEEDLLRFVLEFSRGK